MFSLIIREAWEELQQKQAKESKEFTKPVITQSGEDYLETILVLSQRTGFVRAIDIGEEMGYSKPSVSRAMGLLKAGNYITVDDLGGIHLTDAGREVAERIYERHTYLTRFLTGLGVNPEVAAEDACRIEHVISSESFHAIKESLKDE